MSIRYLTGRAAALKPRLYEELRAALNEGGDEPLIVLVPERLIYNAMLVVLFPTRLAVCLDAIHLMFPGWFMQEENGMPPSTQLSNRTRMRLSRSAMMSISRMIS